MQGVGTLRRRRVVTKHVLSVSLGTPKGDFDAEREFLGQPFRVQRIGTNSDARRFVELLDEHDGQVSCFGFGGGDIHVVAAGRRYRWRREARMAAHAKRSPIVDGSGLKNTVERATIGWLAERGIIDFRAKRTLLVSAVDRFGMAEALAEQGGELIFGDLAFGLGIPIPLRTMRALGAVARVALPVLTACPQSWVYPTGRKQEEIVPRFPRLYEWADVIAGDFKYIRRHLLPDLRGKTIVTNTTMPADLDLLESRGLEMLVTTTMDITLEGRSPGTNVLEAVLVSLIGKRPEEIAREEYLAVLADLDWQPRVVRFGAGESRG